MRTNTLRRLAVIACLAAAVPFPLAAGLGVCARERRKTTFGDWHPSVDGKEFYLENLPEAFSLNTDWFPPAAVSNEFGRRRVVTWADYHPALAIRPEECDSADARVVFAGWPRPCLVGAALWYKGWDWDEKPIPGGMLTIDCVVLLNKPDRATPQFEIARIIPLHPLWEGFLVNASTYFLLAYCWLALVSFTPSVGAHHKLRHRRRLVPDSPTAGGANCDEAAVPNLLPQAQDSANAVRSTQPHLADTGDASSPSTDRSRDGHSRAWRFVHGAIGASFLLSLIWIAWLVQRGNGYNWFTGEEPPGRAQWTAAAAAAGICLFYYARIAFPITRRAVRIRRGRCACCGQLVLPTSARCPECGART